MLGKLIVSRLGVYYFRPAPHLLATSRLRNLRAIAHTRLRLADIAVLNRRRENILLLEALQLLRHAPYRLVSHSIDKGKKNAVRYCDNNRRAFRW